MKQHLEQILFCCLIFLTAALNASAVTMRELLQGPAPQERVYKKTPQGELKIYIFAPPGLKPGERRPAAMWIHGGGWTGGTADSFFPLARYFAARGAVGFSIEYRLVKAGGPNVADCVADCKSAVRFIRSHAAELGVDLQRIAALGDSAGGHLAACLGTLGGFDDPADDHAVSARPDAMVLYDPILDFTESGFINIVIGGAALAKHPSPATLQPTAATLKLARDLSPVFHGQSRQPPAIVLHGLEDKVVSPDQARRFAAAMKQAGNRCDLVLLAGLPHAFVIPNYKCSEAVVNDALSRADAFLTSLGWLSGAPTLEVSDPPAWTSKWPPVAAGQKVPAQGQAKTLRKP